MRVLPYLLSAAAVLLSSPALAQDASAPPALGPSAEEIGGDSLTLGVAAINLPDYEGSNDNRWTPGPGGVGNYKGFSFQLAGNRLSVDVIPDAIGQRWDFQAGPLGVLNLNRTNIDNIEDRQVRALGELDRAVELGGYVGLGRTGIITSPYDKLAVSVSYRRDVNNVHDSGIWQPSINYFTPLSRKAAVGIFASGEHVGDGYARTYFSVSGTGALASGLPVYAAEGGWKNYTLGGLASYSLTGDLLGGLKLVVGGTYTRLLNDFADSPLVAGRGSRSQYLGAVGLAYTF